jgi:hypothetical protein
MNEVTLRDMFESHGGRQIDKWEHYFPVYEKHFARFRGKSPRVLEIGIDRQCSLQLWLEYFPHAFIYGIDRGADTAVQVPSQPTPPSATRK